MTERHWRETTLVMLRRLGRDGKEAAFCDRGNELPCRILSFPAKCPVPGTSMNKPTTAPYARRA